jgi:murein DD-endopeptidase MepM/ murein hydrolase activator NlpD
MKLELYYPVSPLYINQYFGKNFSDLYISQGMLGHSGIDFMAKHGQPIYASHDGICYPEVDSAGGNGVVIRTLIPYDYNGVPTFFKTIYWHLIEDDAVVHTGQQVKAGDIIGYADNTGASTGDHLHFGLKPQAVNESNGAWMNLEQNNGYYGAIDPIKYFNGKFASEISNPKPLFSKTLYFGMWNAEVKTLQTLLGGLVTDGIFGQKTLAKVKEYQSKNGLVVDGIVGPKTQEKLSLKII